MVTSFFISIIILGFSRKDTPKLPQTCLLGRNVVEDDTINIIGGYLSAFLDPPTLTYGMGKKAETTPPTFYSGDSSAPHDGVAEEQDVGEYKARQDVWPQCERNVFCK